MSRRPHGKIASTRAGTAPGMAYVHIPFCENHCLFCGFYQNPWRVDAGASYVDLVLKQAATFEGKKVMEGPPLRALYFGGGTPTALAAKDIDRLVSGLRTLLSLAPDCEITLEGRVHSFTEDKMEAAFKAGVNRVSLGVQTFDTRIRRSLGRKRTKDDVIRTLQTLMAMDSAAIVIDMMYGLPGQTLKSWQDDLTIVDQLGLDGVDHYGLNLIPGTPLMLSIEKGKLEPVTRKQLGTYYAHGTEVMQTMGWEQISPSHWRNLGLRERSVYNFGAKTGWDFFAFGSGAGGKLNGCSFFNNPSLAAYGKLVEAGKNPVIGMSRPTAFTPVMNAIRAGMERSRIDPSAIRTAQLESRMKGQDVLELLQPLLEQYQEAGLMVSRHRFFDLTLPGRFWNVQMTQRMVAWLSGHFLPPDQSGNAGHKPSRHPHSNHKNARKTEHV
ncbi:heme anaerobic degradation radical SAM methyltransferase ChuW/HutW [uncultured Cohaesibacter sp.]|uniref:heme anaerobic degradation radical SAM methyltransferase ChuW/HutW n=1 Tax=uncultured Cohaesibacter sp. TaxID=1002546 RepID=UPI0029C945FC|nr:heme anaerobic degradation radical SAM methyltransferase ChuW/HutW [uncultured Cohaesibacter sp.]